MEARCPPFQAGRQPSRSAVRLCCGPGIRDDLCGGNGGLFIHVASNTVGALSAGDGCVRVDNDGRWRQRCASGCRGSSGGRRPASRCRWDRGGRPLRSRCRCRRSRQPGRISVFHRPRPIRSVLLRRFRLRVDRRGELRRIRERSSGHEHFRARRGLLWRVQLRDGIRDQPGCGGAVRCGCIRNAARLRSGCVPDLQLRRHAATGPPVRQRHVRAVGRGFADPGFGEQCVQNRAQRWY
jgi:hypothetical protein